MYRALSLEGYFSVLLSQTMSHRFFRAHLRQRWSILLVRIRTSTLLRIGLPLLYAISSPVRLCTLFVA